MAQSGLRPPNLHSKREPNGWSKRSWITKKSNSLLSLDKNLSRASQVSINGDGKCFACGCALIKTGTQILEWVTRFGMLIKAVAKHRDQENQRKEKQR